VNPKDFFAELKRRNVYKVAVAYTVVAWLLIQGASIVLPTFAAPAWVMQVLIIVLVLGFPISAVLAWAFEITPEGIKRDKDVVPNESTPPTGRKFIGITIALALVAAGLFAFRLWHEQLASVTTPKTAPAETSGPALTPAPEKSIAVLPFENLSKDEQNAFFADGVQDEILTNLARVTDLKVISRTSVIGYRNTIARNLRKIGQELGVAHVLEGSVQRAGNRVRINAQLVDARNDAHLWAQTYDRDLADVFAIQSEIAKAIADQLRAKLSPSERNAIDLRPTSDITAFDLYARAKDFMIRAASSSANRVNLTQAIDLLNEAVARDPSFFDAYCQLAVAHGQLYLFGLDHTQARLELAEENVEAAARLRPNAGETHLARARNLYQSHLDFDGALAELELARQTLPNDARIFELTSYIQRRQPGRYEEATRNLEHAISLDPRNILMLGQIAGYNYPRLRRYADARSTWDRLLAIEPNNIDSKMGRATVAFDWKADVQPLQQAVDSIRAANPNLLPGIANSWLICALSQRDTVEAEDALNALHKDIAFGTDNLFFTRSFAEGVIARMAYDETKAQSAFASARVEQEKQVRSTPNYARNLIILGLIDAGLGRKEEALSEGRRAVELLPVEKDAADGSDTLKYSAMLAAWVGEKDLACEQLALALHGPSGLTYGELKLSPLWDPLRGDPQFETIVASLAPKADAPND
jgi:TolB-like protein/Tfp pilus assembly protein PilF